MRDERIHQILGALNAQEAEAARQLLGLSLFVGASGLAVLRHFLDSLLMFGLGAPDKHFVQRWPSPKATKKLRDRVRELTSKRQSGKNVKQIVAELTPVLRGWGNYFRTGKADREFNKMDGFVVKSLRRWQYRRGGQRPTKRAPFTGDQLHELGLHQLMGTVKYPAQATQRRSSVSRVPENGTHGLKGGF